MNITAEQTARFVICIWRYDLVTNRVIGEMILNAM